MVALASMSTNSTTPLSPTVLMLATREISFLVLETATPVRRRTLSVALAMLVDTAMSVGSAQGRLLP
jgi:hypothetical protein